MFPSSAVEVLTEHILQVITDVSKLKEGLREMKALESSNSSAEMKAM